MYIETIHEILKQPFPQYNHPFIIIIIIIITLHKV